MIDQKTSMFTARVLTSWAWRRAERAADGRLRHDMVRYVDDMSYGWRRWGARLTTAGGLALAGVLVAIAGKEPRARARR